MPPMSEIPIPYKSDKEERLIALAAHISPLIIGIIWGPIVAMVLKRDSAFIQDQAKEALNFQLTMFIVSLVTCGFGVIITLPMLIIFSVIAGVAAHQGQTYRYPYTFRLIK